MNKSVLVLGVFVVLVVLGGACGKSKVIGDDGGGDLVGADVRAGGDHPDAADAVDAVSVGEHPDAAAVADHADGADAADVGGHPDVADASDAADIRADVAPAGDGPDAADVVDVAQETGDAIGSPVGDGPTIDASPSDGDGSTVADGSSDQTEAGLPPDRCMGMDLALTCGDYCSSLRMACTGANSQYPGADQAAQNAACIAACPTWSCGDFSDTTGNSLNCRTNHAFNALDAFTAGTPSPTECQAAGPNSTVCD